MSLLIDSTNTPTCCCTDGYSLGCLNPCSDIDFGITAPSAGDWKMQFKFGDVWYEEKKTFAIDDPLKFSAKGMNENSLAYIRLIDPDGQQVVFKTDPATTTYECLKVKISQSQGKIQC